MDFVKLLANPVFAFATTIVSIIAGIATSHFYYKKGKKEGERDAREYQSKLRDALRELFELKNLITALEKLAQKSRIEGSEVRDLLMTRTTLGALTEEQIWQHCTTLLSQGKMDEADTFINAYRDQMQESSLAYHKAINIMARGDYSSALPLFEAALTSRNNEMLFYALHNIAVIHMQWHRNPAEALKYADKALTLFPGSLDTLALKAYCLENMGELELAKATLDTILAIDPHNGAALLHLAMYYVYHKQHDLAIETGKRAIDNGGIITDCYMVIADAYVGKQEYDNAVTYVKKVLAANPDHLKGLTIMAGCHVNNGDWLAAERVINRFMKLYPNSMPEIFHSYALVKFREGKPEEVLQTAKQYDFLANIAQNLREVNDMAYACLQISDLERARGYFERLLIASPSFIPAKIGLAQYYTANQTPDLKKAEAYYREVYYSEFEKTPSLLCELANVKLLMKEFDTAIALTNQALQLNENFLPAKDLRAFALSQKNIERSTTRGV